MKSKKIWIQSIFLFLLLCIGLLLRLKWLGSTIQNISADEQTPTIVLDQKNVTIGNGDSFIINGTWTQYAHKFDYTYYAFLTKKDDSSFKLGDPNSSGIVCHAPMIDSALTNQISDYNSAVSSLKTLDFSQSLNSVDQRVDGYINSLVSIDTPDNAYNIVGTSSDNYKNLVNLGSDLQDITDLQDLAQTAIPLVRNLIGFAAEQPIDLNVPKTFGIPGGGCIPDMAFATADYQYGIWVSDSAGMVASDQSTLHVQGGGLIYSLTSDPTSGKQGTDFKFSGDVGADTGTLCNFFVGDGDGNYWSKDTGSIDGDGKCSGHWLSDTTTKLGSHGIAIVLQPAGKSFNTEYKKGESLPQPFYTITVNVCGAQECSGVPAVGISVDPLAIDQSGGPVSIKASPDKANNNLSGLVPFVWVTDGNGTPQYKGNGTTLDDYTFSWNPDKNTSVGTHQVIVTLSSPSAGHDTPDLTYSATMNINVCAAGANSCSQPGQPKGQVPPVIPPKGDTGNDWKGVVASILGTSKITSVADLTNLLVGRWFPLAIGIMAVISIAWGGFQFISSGGDPAMEEKGRKIILYTVIGIVLTVASYIIVYVIIDILRKAGIVQ